MTDRTANEPEAAEEHAEEERDASPEQAAAAPEEPAQQADGQQAASNGAGASEAAPEADAAENEAPADDSVSEEEPTADALAARVAEHNESLAKTLEAALRERQQTIEELHSRLQQREEQVVELQDKLKRKQADFQNFKKRQERKAADKQARATEDLIQRLLPVRDNLVRALEQDENAESGIREGVEGTLKEFDRVLDNEEVTAIEPEAGQSTDPERHEVMMRVESGQPEGTIVDVFRPGYEMADRVVRTAQVTVSDGSGEE